MKDAPNVAKKVPAFSLYACVIAALVGRAHTATKYLSPTLTVKATRLSHGGRPPSKRDRYATIILTIGAPNYRERAFIKAWLKAGERFPVQSLQFKEYGKPRPKRQTKRRRRRVR